jgi:hypothetical protein
MVLLMSLRCALSLAALVVPTLSLAQTAPPEPLAHPRVILVPGNETLPITMSLLPRGLKSGRDTPVFNNYRPQVQFSGEKSPLTCALRIPDPPDKIEPGETLDIGLRCDEDFRVLVGQPGFTMYEGGRLVARGTLRELR